MNERNNIFLLFRSKLKQFQTISSCVKTIGAFTGELDFKQEKYFLFGAESIRGQPHPASFECFATTMLHFAISQRVFGKAKVFKQLLEGFIVNLNV